MNQLIRSTTQATGIVQDMSAGDVGKGEEAERRQLVATSTATSTSQARHSSIS